jgi:hypothetical protein
MADPNETLRDLLVARGIADDSAAADFASSLDAVEAKRLLDLIMSGAGGATKNLSAGRGGFLAGLRLILESRRADAALTLPAEPWKIDRTEKADATRNLDEGIRRSNTAFMDGLRLILENKREEQRASVEVWAGELSDEDFPVKAKAAADELEESNRRVLELVNQQLENQAKTTSSLIQEHRDAADE